MPAFFWTSLSLDNGGRYFHISLVGLNPVRDAGSVLILDGFRGMPYAAAYV